MPSFTNIIGDSELLTVWEDPDFDPCVRALYYARVLEIPIPHWNAYDVKYYAVEMSEDVPMVSMERANTSPIWYMPGHIICSVTGSDPITDIRWQSLGSGYILIL